MIEEKRNNKVLKRLLIALILLVVLGGLAYAFLSGPTKEMKTSYIMVGAGSSGTYFVNDDVPIFVIDFNKLEKGVDYNTVEREIYFYVNANSRVYVLATENEIDVYIYQSRAYVKLSDITRITVRLSGEKIDVIPKE